MEHEKQLMAMVEKHESLIYAAADHIWANPEPGYREWKTTAYMEKTFEDLGYTLVKAGNIPGFYTDIDTGRPGPKIAIMAELDSLIVGNHPDADPETCAVHACGHHAQSAMLVGVAAALKEPGALDGMCGSIRLMSIPAEEMIELGFREGLRKQGLIKYYCGKVEFIARGYFDGVDMAMMIHSSNLPEGKAMAMSPGSNGAMAKNLTLKGVSSHAGGSPDKGRNALYAATTALNAANALRETFLDDKHIRFHPIITEGGMAVNAIPETVKIETFVRGADYECIFEYNQKINQAFAASAAAIGCNVEIDDHPGYYPLITDSNLEDVMREAMTIIAGPDSVIPSPWSTGCTDVGDVSAIMPVCQPFCGGSIGLGHGKDYYVADKKLGCLYPAQNLVLSAYILLKDDAARAKKVIAEGKPIYASKEEYLAAIDKLTMNKDAVIYNEDGSITLDFVNN